MFLVPMMIPISESRPCSKCACGKCQCDCHPRFGLTGFLIGFSFLALLTVIIISLIDGGVDGAVNSTGGTSYVAIFMQHTPTYALTHWLSLPRN
jgi:hypothetical protein